MITKRYEELMTENVQTVLRQILGQPASELVYGYIEKQVFLERDDASDRLEAFFGSLEKLFGFQLARVVRDACFRLLYLKLRREYEEIDAYVALLDELYKTRLKLINSGIPEKAQCSMQN